jgi:large subunit ribosomal protein L19
LFFLKYYTKITDRLHKKPLYAKVIAMEITTEKFTPVATESRKKLDFKAGDTVKVWNKILEKGKIRLQAFEGLVLSRKHGFEPGATFTVRKVASGVGVERTFPLYSPSIERIEILKKSKTRRSKLYFIRDKAVKEVRKRLKSITLAKEVPEEKTEEEKLEEVGKTEEALKEEVEIKTEEQVKDTNEEVTEDKAEEVNKE